MVFCQKCGAEIDESDQFCKSCGNPTNNLKNDSVNKKNQSNIKSTVINSEKVSININDEDNRILLIPLILGIIGVIVGLIEGLICPMLFGWENILAEMVVAVAGGCIGLYMLKFQKEYLITGIQFIVTGIMMILLIRTMAFIGSIIFIIAGISTIFIFKSYHVNKKSFIAIPIMTVILAFLVIFIVVGSGVAFENSLADQVNITNVQSTIAQSYGYYDGDLKGDITIGSDLDYLNMKVDYFDESGKVLYSGYGITQNNLKAGQTYQFSSFYMEKEKPVKAQIILEDSVSSDEPFYVRNVTL